jgi:hypothetical protein
MPEMPTSWPRLWTLHPWWFTPAIAAEAAHLPAGSRGSAWRYGPGHGFRSSLPSWLASLTGLRALFRVDSSPAVLATLPYRLASYSIVTTEGMTSSGTGVTAHALTVAADPGPVEAESDVVLAAGELVAATMTPPATARRPARSRRPPTPAIGASVAHASTRSYRLPVVACSRR